MKRISLILTAVLLLTAFFTGCANNEPVAAGYQGIDVVSPEWVGKLDVAKGCLSSPALVRTRRTRGSRSMKSKATEAGT